MQTVWQLTFCFNFLMSVPVVSWWALDKHWTVISRLLTFQHKHLYCVLWCTYNFTVTVILFLIGYCKFKLNYLWSFFLHQIPTVCNQTQRYISLLLILAHQQVCFFSCSIALFISFFYIYPHPCSGMLDDLNKK